MTEKVAHIAVEAANYGFDKLYTYRIGEHQSAAVGMRCVVPFGRGNRCSEGVIVGLGQAEGEKLKTIERLLDSESILTDQMLHLAAFVRERYFCTYYQAIRALLPAGVWFKPRQTYRLAQIPENWQESCPPEPAQSILQVIKDLGGQAEYDALRNQFPLDRLDDALRALRRKGWISADTDFDRRVKDKTARWVSLQATVEEVMSYVQRVHSAAPMQAAVLKTLADVGTCDLKELRYFTGASMSTIHALVDRELIRLETREALRLPEIPPVEKAPELLLNPEQQEAYSGLCRQWDREKPGSALLYGVTGSGKTAVYIKLIERCLRSGRQAILMVPEIGLTPQLVQQFAAHFGRQIAVVHSSVPMAQRYDTFKQIRRGEVGVVIGTRSAVFAPVPKLGLIVVDEEQEHTYRSENAPRYNAVEVAMFRSVRERALAVLGSATPSVETMYRAQSGLIGLYTLKARFNQQELPRVAMVNMRQELRQGNGSCISQTLAQALSENHRQGRQSILFINRRGSNQMTVCEDCGYVPECKRCSVHLTYHQANNRLMCHYCGYSEPMPGVCPVCGGKLRRVGYGTQSVETELDKLLPGVGVIRMDADAVSAANPHETILRRFREEKIPILLGTQMVTKGLNFENVTLVGVVNADSSLYNESYRAAENTFDMITQVVGRAGRGQFPGRALIQTMTPENSVLRMAAEQDYDAFYRTEIRLRQLRGCPPFRDNVVIYITAQMDEFGAFGAKCMGRMLRDALSTAELAGRDMMILGPSPDTLFRLNGRWRYRITLGCKLDKPMRRLISQVLVDYANDRHIRNTSVYVVVNGND